MKGNQGLEALAALCGGQSDAPTEDTRGTSHVGGGEGTTTGAPSSRTPLMNGTQVASAAQQGLQGGQRQNNQVSQQFPFQNMTQQQLQQALAASNALQRAGVNPAVAVQNLLVSAGLMPQQQNMDSATLAAMQQLAYNQIVQAQAKLAMQQAQAAIATSSGGVSLTEQAQQALAMALAAGSAQQRLQVQGKPTRLSFASLYRLGG